MGPKSAKSPYRYILGIQSFANANSGASIVRFTADGSELDFVAISEERLIRKKHPYTFPVHSLGYCMEAYGLNSLDEIDLLVGDFFRIKRWHRSGPAHNCSEFDYLKTKLDIPAHKIVQVSHHMAHAASAFYTSSFDEAAILVVDGHGSDLETTSFLMARNGKIRYVDSYRARGIGAVYAAVTNWLLGLGDGGDGGEGKTMALAPFGAPYDPVLAFDSRFDGVKNDYSAFMRRMPNYDVLNHVDPAHRVNPLHGDHRLRQDGEQVTEPYFARAAFDVQMETERALSHLGRALYDRTRCPNLCVSGGVALNSVANKIMFDATEFENIFVFPACSDAGIPFGLAIWGYYNAKELGDRPRRKLTFRNAYTGRDYAQEEIDAVLRHYGVEAARTTPREVAQLIADGSVVGWFQGASEYGPRALGHRSILADSRREEMKDIVNIRVKHRETYRPFAPAVLLQDCAEYFDIEEESPYMLLVADCKKPQVVPAVTHIDATARVQTVTREANGVFYDLIEAFKDITGVPVILNTSFNDAGEPIVETPVDALICFLRTGLDYLVLGDQLIKASAQGRELAERMLAERAAQIAEREKHNIDRFFPGYDPAERDRYIEAENRKAVWHASRRAIDELEKKTQQWIRDGSRVLIVGTPDHTAVAAQLVRELLKVDVVGFVPFQSKVDEPALSDRGMPALPFKPHPWIAITEHQYDEILISSHEYLYEIRDALRKAGVRKPVYEIYDNASRSLMSAEGVRPAILSATA